MGENNYGAYHNTIDLLAFVRFVFRKSYYIFFGITIGIIAAIPINILAVKPTYSCEAKYYLTVSEDVVSYGALQATTTIMQDYLAMIKSKSVVKRAIDKEGLNIDVNTALGMIKVSNPDETHLLVVTVKSQDRQQTENLMNAVSYQIVNYIPGIMEGSSLLLFEEPDVVLNTGTSSKILNMVLLSITFASIAVLILLLLFLIKPVAEDPEDITRVTGGIRTYLLPSGNKRFMFRRKKKQEARDRSLNSVAEEITYDLTLGAERTGVIMVTSTDEVTGGTIVARKLYDSLCKEGSDVLFVDRDLTQLWETRSDKKTIIKKSSLLFMEHRGTLAEALDRLKDSYDFIIIDTVPVLQKMDPLFLARHCDKVVMVAEYGRTSVPDLVKGIQRFKDNKLTIHAIVLNMCK